MKPQGDTGVPNPNEQPDPRIPNPDPLDAARMALLETHGVEPMWTAKQVTTIVPFPSRFALYQFCCKHKHQLPEPRYAPSIRHKFQARYFTSSEVRLLRELLFAG